MDMQTLLDVSAVPKKHVLILPCLMDQGQGNLTAAAVAVKVAVQGAKLMPVSHFPFSSQ